MSNSQQRKPIPKAKVVRNAKNIRERYRADGTVRGYEVRYRDPENRDRHGNPAIRGKIFRTVEAAKEWQARNTVQILDGEFITPEKSKTTWKLVADDWLDVQEAKLRARTVSGYGNVLARWLSDWDSRAIGDIETCDVQAVIKRLRTQGRKVGTEHHVFNVMNAVLAYAVRHRYIKSNPADGVRTDLRGTSHKEFEATALTTEEAMKIVDALPEGRFRVYGLLGLWTGFRAGELAGLRVRNLDPLRKTIQVEQTVEDLGGVLRPGTTKTKKSKGRVVPVPAQIMEQVVAYVGKAGLGPNDYMFAGPNEYFRHANFYHRQWKAACKKAGLEGTRFHTLRHSFASLRARQGVPPHVLMTWMGHSTITVTMNVYAHVYDEDAKDREFVERIFRETTSSATNAAEVGVAGGRRRDVLDRIAGGCH